MTHFNFLFLLPPILSLAFLCAALILLKIVPARMKKNIAVCTVAVSARITDLMKSYFRSSSGKHRTCSYAPIYEFTFNGEKQSVASVLYSSKKPTIGQEITLMIDPNNVNHFYDPSSRPRTMLIVRVVGIVMLILGIGAAVTCALIYSAVL